MQKSAPLTPQEQIQKENNDLRMQLAKMQETARDNKALHDQFQTTNPSPRKLIAAAVIGRRQDELFIDKGDQDGIHAGDVVVVKDNLIGKVTKTTPYIAVVTLITNPSTSFTAETAKTAKIGVIKSQGGDSIIFDNVVLSDKLEKNDIVVTKGDVVLQSGGYPPKLVVGKIVSINKKASNLFQSAKVESLVDLSALQLVFVQVEK